MEIIEYQQKYKDYFVQFNTDWIVDNFGFLEEEDKNAFLHIEESLKNGAMIYFAVEEENVLAPTNISRTRAQEALSLKPL